MRDLPHRSALIYIQRNRKLMALAKATTNKARGPHHDVYGPNISAPNRQRAARSSDLPDSEYRSAYTCYPAHRQLLFFSRASGVAHTDRAPVTLHTLERLFEYKPLVPLTAGPFYPENTLYNTKDFTARRRKPQWPLPGVITYWKP